MQREEEESHSVSDMRLWIGNIGGIFVNLFREWSMCAIVLRLLFSLIAGTIIGIDRGLKRRGAGVKTHVIVCLGSALVMITSEYMAIQFEGQLDMARLGAQVVSGVGFLGVGTILVTGKNQVRGLTTAAGIWVCACIGLAAGIGFIEGAVVTLILVMGTFGVLMKLDVLVQRFSRIFDLYLEFDTNRSVSRFLEEMHRRGMKVQLLDISKEKHPEKITTAIVSVEVRKYYKEHMELVDEIREMNFVRYVEEL